VARASTIMDGAYNSSIMTQRSDSSMMAAAQRLVHRDAFRSRSTPASVTIGWPC
jgi:hypothetical protein